MMFTYKTAKFAPVWTSILKIRAIFVHQTLTEHAFYTIHLDGIIFNERLKLWGDKFFNLSESLDTKLLSYS